MKTLTKVPTTLSVRTELSVTGIETINGVECLVGDNLSTYQTRHKIFAVFNGVRYLTDIKYKDFKTMVEKYK
jgi:hypothetical protein